MEKTALTYDEIKARYYNIPSERLERWHDWNANGKHKLWEMTSIPTADKNQTISSEFDRNNEITLELENQIIEQILFERNVLGLER